MATLDRLNPDIDHVGLNWSCWIDKFDILTDEDVFPLHSGGSKEEDVDASRRSDTMTLSKEDMKIYGYCPALDHFSLVVCSHCGHLVKPQAFEAHCDRRHSAVTKLCCPPPGRADQQCPRPGRLPSIPSSSRERHKVGDSQEAGGFSKAASAPQHRTAKVQTEETRSPSVKTSGAQEAPPSSPCPSPSHPRAPPRAHAPLTPGTPVSSSSSHSSSSSAPASQRQKPTAGPSGPPSGPPRGGPRTYSRTHKKVYQKDGDLEKHRGVLEPARKTLCTRQLVCNIHSVPRRRAPPGRGTPPDRLAPEQRAGSSGSDADKLSAGEEGPAAPPAPAPYHPQAAQDPAAPKRGKRSPGAGRPPMLWTREPVHRGPEEEEADCAVEVEIQPPYPFNQSLPSSGGSEDEDEEEEEEEEEEEGGGKEKEEEDAQEEEEEEEEEEENGDIPATPWHPKPLGICTFGSHTLGCSVFTFDRRLHHLRFALSDMVEQHVNTHLWKRIPQVPAVLQARRPAAAPQGSALKPRAPPGSGSPPSGPRRHKPDLPGSGPPSAAEPHPARDPAGRPGRAPPKGREPAPVAAARPTQSAGRVETSAAPVRTFPPRERKDQRRRHPPAPPLRPPAVAPRGAPDGHRALAGATPSDRGSPSPPSSLRRGTGPGGRQQQGAGGPDFRGPAHKRKMSSSDWSPSGHRAQPRSSAQSHRSAGPSPGVGLFSWRKGSGLGTSPGD